MAASRSASSNTMKGACPPSSRDIFLMLEALCCIRIRPTGVDPVKVTLRTTGLAQSTLPIAMELSLSAVMMLSTPGGMPACSASTARANAERGVCSAGLSTIVQPAAMAGATLRVIIALGKFQGVMAAQTPIGSRNTNMRLVASGAEIVSPMTRLACSANHSTKEAP